MTGVQTACSGWYVPVREWNFSGGSCTIAVCRAVRHIVNKAVLNGSEQPVFLKDTSFERSFNEKGSTHF